MRVHVPGIAMATLKSLDLHYPTPDEAKREWFTQMRRLLK